MPVLALTVPRESKVTTDGTVPANRGCMAFVITETCETCLDAACVDVCPVDCIHGPAPVEEIRGRPRRGLQLFIDPESCICCSACVPECPVGAILDEEDEGAEAARRKNAQFFLDRESDGREV